MIAKQGIKLIAVIGPVNITLPLPPKLLDGKEARTIFVLSPPKPDVSVTSTDHGVELWNTPTLSQGLRPEDLTASYLASHLSTKERRRMLEAIFSIVKGRMLSLAETLNHVIFNSEARRTIYKNMARAMIVKGLDKGDWKPSVKACKEDREELIGPEWKGWGVRVKLGALEPEGGRESGREGERLGEEGCGATQISKKQRKTKGKWVFDEKEIDIGGEGWLHK